MTIGRSGTLALVFILTTSGTLHAQDWKPSRLWVAGSDRSTWVLGASDAKGPALPVVQMWYAGESAEPSAAKQTFYLAPVSGDPIFVGADAEALRVLFSDLTACDYFGNRPYSAGAAWKEQCRRRPLAWAGDTTSDVFWALAETEDLVAPTTTTTADSAPAPASESQEPGPSRLTLLRLHGGAWRRTTAPAASEEGKAFWIAGREGAPYLFWAVGTRVIATSREDGEWKPPKTVLTDAEVRQAWAGAAATGAVFIAARRSDAERYQLHVYLEKDGEWSAAGAVREGNELLEIDPSACGVGVVRGQLGIARATKGGDVELGTAALGVAPALRFSPPLARQRDEPTLRTPWEDAVTLGVLLAVLTATLWSRRAEAVRALEFPRGLGPAAVWKRVAATPIDMAPAFFATSPWWMPKMAAFMQEHGMRLTAELQPVLAGQLRVETYATYLVYGFWCFLWEALAGRTPGKMIVGCRVISVNGAAASATQCLVRNIVRVVMVSLGVSGLLMTLMMILLVTRNRQRIGDLLAHTVVVEPAPADKADAGRQEDDAMGPFE